MHRWLVVASVLVGCGSAGTPTAGSTASGSSAAGANGATGSAGSTASSGTTGSGTGSTASSSGSSSSSSSGSSGSTGDAADPAADGPYAVAKLDGSYDVDGESSAVPVTATYPTSGPAAGPYPTVIIAHGFQLDASLYDGYAHRLATFGYVALNVDYPASAFSPNHAQAALDLLGALDWAAGLTAPSPLAGLADVQHAGITGHSLGGKLSILAAAKDARVKAIIALDPVDDASNCSAQDCPTAASRMPLAIPTAFLGETIDEQPVFGTQSCAPADENFQSLYALASSPSLAVDVAGADHMSFIDSTSGCFVCAGCQPATAPQQQVLDLARAEVTAFYERHLRGDTRDDAYLSGTIAQQRYVTTNEATIETK